MSKKDIEVQAVKLLGEKNFCDCTIAFNGTALELNEMKMVYSGDPALVCSHLPGVIAEVIRTLEREDGLTAGLVMEDLCEEFGYKLDRGVKDD